MEVAWKPQQQQQQQQPPAFGFSARPPAPPPPPLIDVKGLAQVPPRFLRPPQELSSKAAYALDEQQVPVIDLAGDDKAAIAAKMAEASGVWGFFQIVNHGIPEELLQHVKDVCWKFYELPNEEKHKYAIQGVAGDGYGQKVVFSEDQPMDWGNYLSLTHLPPFMKNPAKWPQEPRDFKETVETYCDQAKQVAEGLLKNLAAAIGLEDNYFISEYTQPSELIRINFYPPCPQPDLVLGLSPHSDYGGITVLLQDDDTPGLQIKKDGQWLDVQPIKNALVVNIGDQLEVMESHVSMPADVDHHSRHLSPKGIHVMSNGRFKSVEHRATANGKSPRLSVAAFYNPGMKATIRPAPGLIDEAHPALYESYALADYFGRVFQSKMAGKNVLDSFKLTHP